MAGEVAQASDERSWLYRPGFPDKWKRMSLLSMARWVNGLAFRDFQFSDTGKPVIKIAEIKCGITGQTKFTNQTFEASVFVTNGDMLFSWSGQPETSIDVFWWRGPDGWLNQHIFKVTPIEELAPVFFFYLLRYLKPNFIGIARNKQTTGLGHVTRRDIENIEAAFPPLAEQKAIASILGALDDKIELNRRMNATLEAMARALFRSWFVDFDPVRANMDRRGQPSPRPSPTGRGRSAAEGEGAECVGRGGKERVSALFPSPTGRTDGDEGFVAYDKLFPDSFQDSELGPIPKGWKVGTIQDCCLQVKNGGTPRRNEPRFWDGGNIPWLTSGEVRQSIITATESFITEEGLKESSAKWVPAFSTVVALYGATAGQVSFTASRLTTNQAVCALLPKEGFAFFNYLTMRGATAELEKKAVGSAQQNISKGIVEKTQVVLPPTALVERFGVLARPLFERWISNLHQSRTLAALRDTLLPKLLSGELRVPEAMIRAQEALQESAPG